VSEGQIYAELGRISGKLRGIEVSQANLGSRVGELSQTQQQTQSQVQQLHSLVASFIVRDRKDKSVQTARVELLRLDNVLSSEFGHHKEVRRHATGILQAMDVAIVSQDTLRFATEAIMLGTPGYWLAPALVALASWIRDDRPMAERALAEALSRDNDKTALFFGLVLRRHRRDEACARWIAQYTARQDPARLPQEFAVILDAVATGSLGPQVRPAVAGVLTQWLERAVDTPQVVEEQVFRWQTLLDGMRQTLSPKSYPNLRALSPSWPALKAAYEGATVHGAADCYFRQQFDGPVPVDPGLEGRIDDLLKGLVTRYDEEEAVVRREQALHRAMIEHDGDEATARAAVAAQESLHEHLLPLPTLLTNVAFFSDRDDLSPATQRLATACVRDWIVKAHNRLGAANRRALPDVVKIKIDGWSSSIRADTRVEELVAGYDSHIDRTVTTRMSEVKLGGLEIGGGVFGLLMGVFALVALGGGSPGFGIFLLLVCGALLVWVGTVYRKLPAKRESIRSEGEARKRKAAADIRAVVSEAAHLVRAWEAETAKAESLNAFLTSLSPGSFIESDAGRQREVLS